MGWAGRGALVAWHDVEPGREVEYQHWHAHEHMQERLSVPGFQRGRRYSAVGDGPSFLIIYEVDSPDVFTSAAYLDRLNQPSDWTKRLMPALRNMNRSLCRVAASGGSGVGRFLQTTRFSPRHGREVALQNAVGQAIAGIVTSELLCSAHLLIADRDRSTVTTFETELRRRQDDVADWVLLVEGFSEKAVTEDRSALLTQGGAEQSMIRDLYALDHLVTGASG